MNHSGFDTARLNRLTEAISDDIARGRYYGAAVIVSRAGKVALREALGSADVSGDRALSHESVFPLLSITKSLLAVLVLSYVERGALALNTLIADLIPEFGSNGKAAVTVAQLLSHTGGLGDEIPPGYKAGSSDEVLAHICKAPLRSAPGRFAYSGEAGYFVLGEVVRRVSGDQRSLSALMHQHVFAPLAMNSTSLTATPELAARRVPISVVGELQGMYSPQQLQVMERAFAAGFEEAGGSAVSTVDDLHRFARMLAGGGALEGTRILSPATVRLATQIHTGADEFGALQFGRQLVGWPELRANYGLGFQMRGPVAFQAAQHGTLASAGTFGHRGAGLTCYWIDPATQVIFVCLCSGFLEETRSTERWQRLSDIVHASILE